MEFRWFRWTSDGLDDLQVLSSYAKIGRLDVISLAGTELLQSEKRENIFLTNNMPSLLMIS